MSRKLTFNQAAKIMKAADLEPLEDYPGNKEKWKCKCLKCGKTVFPSLGSARRNGGGCKDCGIKLSADSRRNSEKDVVKIMKNAGALPLEPYSNSKKPWLCRCLTCKKEITPTFGNVRNGTKPCAYCSKKKVHPVEAIKIMRKAGLEPLAPYPGSNTKWKCKHLKCGEIVYPMHSWIVAGQGGCQKCGYIESGLNGRVSEKLAMQVMKKAGLTPLTPYMGAHKPWKSKCAKCKQIVSPHYSSIQSGTGCGVCAGKVVIPEMAIKLMKRAKLDPLVPYPGGKTNWKCRCIKCGQIVYPNYGDIQQGDGGCKYCARHFVKPEDAVALMRLNNLEPLEPYKKTGSPWKCRCMKCNRIVTPRHNSIQTGSGGCKYCSRTYLDAEDAINLMRKAKLEPLAPYPGSQKPWRCKCLRCGREVSPAYTSVQGGQKGCIYCGGKKVDPQEAIDFMASKGLQPLEKYKRADGPWKCRCKKCLKIVTPSYSAMRQGQGSCVYCAGKKVDPSDAVALFLENNLKPLEPFQHTEKKWKSECLKCHRIVYPKHHMVQQRSGGCRYCANKGIDFTLPAYIYLITHSELQAHKVGISGQYANEDRLQDHSKEGWVLYKKKIYLTADKALFVEQLTLKWLRDERGLPTFLSREQMPQAGWTETVDASEIDLPTIWSKVEELSKKRIKKR